MKRKLTLALALILGSAMFAGANLLLNSGFETNGLQSWTSEYWAWDDPVGWTHGSYWGSIGHETWHPHSGSNSAYMYKWGAGDSVDSGYWQETTNDLGAGSIWTASAWVYSDANYSNQLSQIRIEFMNGAMSQIGSWSNSFAVPGESYTLVSVTGTAPVDTAWARLAVEVKHTGMELSEGTFFVDDASLVGAIPEPATAFVLGIGLASIYVYRRRRRA